MLFSSLRSPFTRVVIAIAIAIAKWLLVQEEMLP